MRIIAGTCKGRKLRVPKDDRVRPTPDRIKEAIFSMLLPYIDGETVVADVFAGTGNMGLEALSRGAGKAYFSDVSAENIALIKQNIALCFQ
jgi:16S rRNA (guanine966-N2)-methyltransferase